MELPGILTGLLIHWEMKRVASLEASVNVAGKFAPGIPGIPFVGEINRYSKYAQQVAMYEEPEKVNALNMAALDALSTIENFGGNEASNQYFLENTRYSPIMKRVITESLTNIRGVRDLGSLVQAASTAGSEEVARFYVVAIAQLADYHLQERKLKAVVQDVIIPAAVSDNNTLIVPLPVDHWIWTKDVAKFFAESKKKVFPEYKVQSTEIRVAGTLSDMSKKQLSALGVNSVKDRIGY